MWFETSRNQQLLGFHLHLTECKTVEIYCVTNIRYMDPLLNVKTYIYREQSGDTDALIVLLYTCTRSWNCINNTIPIRSKKLLGGKRKKEDKKETYHPLIPIRIDCYNRAQTIYNDTDV